MKKKGLLLAFLVLLLTTGCGKKKLTCTREEDGQKSTLKVNFKDDKAEKVTLGIEMEFDEEVDDKELDERIKSFKEYYESSGFEDVEVKAKGKKLNISVSMDANKFMANAEDEELSYDSIKKELEDGEYTCK